MLDDISLGFLSGEFFFIVWGSNVYVIKVNKKIRVNVGKVES